MGLVLNPSAICVFKVAGKYLDVNNMAHKQDTDRLALTVTFVRTSPFEAGWLPPFRSSRNVCLYRPLKTFLLLSHPALLQ